MREQMVLVNCFSYLLISTAGFAKGCPHSSCGALQNIGYPFYLRGSPSKCGDNSKRQELLCIGNKAILDFHSIKYYVDAISYEEQSLKLTIVGFDNSSCIFPGASKSFGVAMEDDQYSLSYRDFGWVSYVNCTKMVHNDMYLPISCFSRNNTFIYAVYSDFELELRNLEPSCRFYAGVPLPYNASTVSSEANLFQLMRKGFTLSWIVSGRANYKTFLSGCLREALWLFKEDITTKNILAKVWSLVRREKDFLSCLEDYTGDKKTITVFEIAIAVMVFIEILQLLIALAILGRFVFAPMVVLAFLAYKLYRTRATVDTVEEFLQNQPSMAPKRYSYIELIAMTNHFREKLGQGGFGAVFKGKLPGNCTVAIKMLGNSKCDGDEFINEVSTIGRIHHVNVVRLVGFCSDGSRRALVYEYMPNGSLDKYIFSSSGKNMPPLTSEKLSKIAVGVARGIDYLHQGCDVRILHFDIKPHNILLDHNFDPKVADFGLAKLHPRGYSFVSFSAARGTIGYIAPEVISRSFGVISFKSDVYSFGMLLMEMAGGRRNADPRAESSSQDYYPSWIYDRLVQPEEPEFDNSYVIGDLERKLCKVGLWCIQMKPSDRPSMNEVVEMLEADVDAIQMPPKPFFSSAEPRVVVFSSCNNELDTIQSGELEHLE